MLKALLTNLPNAITMLRIALTPVFILLVRDHRYGTAFAVFVLAGISDGLDGFIAKRYNFITRLGGILDPVADKILLVSAYIMLSLSDQLPFWLALSVVFRDVLIVGGYLAYTSIVGPVHMRPSRLSKLNTVLQVTLVVAVLSELSGWSRLTPVVEALIYIVFVTTFASAVHYVWVWGVLKNTEADVRAKRQR